MSSTSSTHPERRQNRRIITLASASQRSRAASSAMAFSSALIFWRRKVADSSSSNGSPAVELVGLSWLPSAADLKRPRRQRSFWGEYISSYDATCRGSWWRAPEMGLGQRFPRQEVAAAVVHGCSSGAQALLPSASTAARRGFGDFDRRALLLVLSSCAALPGPGALSRSAVYGDEGNRPRAYNGSVAGARCWAP